MVLPSAGQKQSKILSAPYAEYDPRTELKIPKHVQILSEISGWYGDSCWYIAEPLERLLKKSFWWTPLILALVPFLIYLTGPSITLCWSKHLPWYVESHQSWLSEHGIEETTWILDRSRDIYTSNNPSFVGDVLLQFPQHGGHARIMLHDVRYDPTSYHSVISIPKLPTDSDILVAEIKNRRNGRVIALSLEGLDTLATGWGRNTYILQAWTKQRS